MIIHQASSEMVLMETWLYWISSDRPTQRKNISKNSHYFYAVILCHDAFGLYQWNSSILIFFSSPWKFSQRYNVLICQISVFHIALFPCIGLVYILTVIAGIQTFCFLGVNRTHITHIINALPWLLEVNIRIYSLIGIHRGLCPRWIQYGNVMVTF